MKVFFSFTENAAKRMNVINIKGILRDMNVKGFRQYLSTRIRIIH